MRTTIKDIARETGLSTTTISLVLNRKPHRIAAETCQLVFETAKRMKYRPNKLAVGLIKNVTRTIGLIIPDIANVFFSEITKGLQDALYEKEYNLILCNSNDNNQAELRLIEMLNSQLVDGIVLVMSSETYGEKEKASISALQKMEIPTILIDCFNESAGFSTVSIDNFQASKMAVEYLISLGHTSIACICGPLGPKTNDDRLAGYTAALEEHGINYNEDLIYEGDFRYDSGYNAVAKLLLKNPTAILCLNDLMAYGAMNALKEQGISVPDDISVMGFDDIFFSKITEVPLTCVNQPSYDMGRKAGELVMYEIEEHGEPQTITFESTIKIRQSTKKYNANG